MWNKQLWYSVTILSTFEEKFSMDSGSAWIVLVFKLSVSDSYLIDLMI